MFFNDQECRLKHKKEKEIFYYNIKMDSSMIVMKFNVDFRFILNFHIYTFKTCIYNSPTLYIQR